MNTNNLDQRVEFHSPLEFGYAVFENILLSSGMYFLWSYELRSELFL